MSARLETPLLVVNIAPKVAADPGYQAALVDVKAWERRHGPIPAGSVVMIRSDCSQKWQDPQRFTWQPFPESRWRSSSICISSGTY